MYLNKVFKFYFPKLYSALSAISGKTKTCGYVVACNLIIDNIKHYLFRMVFTSSFLLSRVTKRCNSDSKITIYNIVVIQYLFKCTVLENNVGNSVSNIEKYFVLYCFTTCWKFLFWFIMLIISFKCEVFLIQNAGYAGFKDFSESLFQTHSKVFFFENKLQKFFTYFQEIF